MGDNKEKPALTLTIKKVQNETWKIKSDLSDFKRYHRLRKTQSNNLKRLLRSERKLLVAKRQENRIPNTNANRNVRSNIREPLKATDSKTQNSVVQTPNIAIGIVSLVQPDAISSLLRQNNVEIPMSSLNLNNNVPNTNKDINNNNSSDASTAELSLNTRDDNNKNNNVIADNITNQTKPIHKERENNNSSYGSTYELSLNTSDDNNKNKNVIADNITNQSKTNNNSREASTGQQHLNIRDDNNKNNNVVADNITKSNQIVQEKAVETGEKTVKLLDMETQTDDVIEVNSIDSQKSVDKSVSAEVPASPTTDNTPRKCLSPGTMQSLCQLSDWNKFLIQTEMSRTHREWFDPNPSKKNAAFRKSGQRKRKLTEIVEYDHDLFWARQMMLKNPAGMSGLGDQAMSSAPVVPTMLMAPPVYNTRSSQRLDPYRFNQNIQQYMPVQPVNMGQPRMGNSYQPNMRHQAPWQMPAGPSVTSTVTSGLSRGYTSRTRWQEPSMDQFLEAQQRGTMLRAALRADPMAQQTFIDDPRRRNRK